MRSSSTPTAGDPNHWVPRLTSRELYGQLVTAHGDFFRKSPQAWRLPLDTTATNPATYRALAPAVQGVAARDAVVVAALGSSDDLYACWQRVVQESWFYGAFTDVRDMLNAVWSPYSQFPRDDAHKLASPFNERTMSRFGAEVLAQTPVLLFDSELARNYITSVWRFSALDDADKSKVAGSFHKLDWMPYDAKSREYIFADARNEFRVWAEQARNRQRDAKGKLDNATRALEGARKQREDEAKKPNAQPGGRWTRV